MGEGVISALKLVPPGEAEHYLLSQVKIEHRIFEPITLWHGSSLSLITKATDMLNQHFSEMDPEKDFKVFKVKKKLIVEIKVEMEEDWKSIVSVGKHPISAHLAVTCKVARLLLDGDFDTINGKEHSELGVRHTKTAYYARRIIIDYLFTKKEFEGRGFGGRLFDQVKRLAKRYNANLYVLSLEESCVYWMSKGFVLEEGSINQRLNNFPDTHLLKLPTNSIEDESCLEVADESEESTEDEKMKSQSDIEGVEDETIQHALIASLQQRGWDGRPETSEQSLQVAQINLANKENVQCELDVTDMDKGDDEENLKKAIELSLKE